MTSDRGAPDYRYPPRDPPAAQRAGCGSLVGFGCLGTIVGMLLGLCGSVAVALALVTATPSTTMAEPAPGDTDMTITVQESYFNDMVSKAMPDEWQGNLQMDVQPGNKVAVGGRVEASLFGQTIAGDVSGTIGIAAEDGLLVLALEDVQAFGFSLGGLADAFTEQLWKDASVMVNQQVKNGLGDDVEILGVATDDVSLVLRVRLP